MILKLGMQHRGLKLYKVYINGDPGLTMTYFTARSNLETYLYLLSLQLVLCRVAALKSGPVHRPKCSLNFTFGPLKAAEIF